MASYVSYFVPTEYIITIVQLACAPELPHQLMIFMLMMMMMRSHGDGDLGFPDKSSWDLLGLCHVGLKESEKEIPPESLRI